MKSVTAIVLAAGAGTRFGGEVAKAFQPLAGRPIVLRTLDKMFASRFIDSVILVVAADAVGYCTNLLQSDDALRHRRWVLQVGGASRQQSARRGLECVVADGELVVLHDAARPLISPALIDRCLETAAEKRAVVLGLPVRDTIKEVSSDGWIRATPDRSALWEIQTPQVFERELIVRAHQRAEGETSVATDDAALVERIGVPVFVLEGERTNLKITVPEDLWLAELMIREGRVF